jgi:hypothetical protein
MTMKRTNMAEDIHNQEEDDLLPEYRFDYAKAHPNRFAKGIAEGSLVVVLEPELAQVFKTSEQVKAILRAIADTMPQVEAGTVSG